jgi:hypothetical protein
LVADAVPSDERHAAGNGGVFSWTAGSAVGCAFAGLLELTRTLGAFGNLQFIPTEATEGMFVSWTWAMLAAPAAVIASAILIAAAVAHVRTHAALWSAVIGMVATLWLAARVWENVTGYLTTASDSGPSADALPLPPDRWPFVYRHGVSVLVCSVVLAICAIAYVLWRIRPRSITFALGILLALAVVFAGGQFGFAAVAFLRLRNLSVAVAAIDLAVAAVVLRRRRLDVVLLAALLMVAASAWRIDRSWRMMLPEMPHGIEFPQW